jgi:hypothetical protein
VQLESEEPAQGAAALGRESFKALIVPFALDAADGQRRRIHQRYASIALFVAQTGGQCL